MQILELERPISDIVPHIFKRPVLSISPADLLLQAGTFLAIGPQIYVDGLVVLDGQKPVGRIGGQHIVHYILEHPDGWFQSTLSRISSHSPSVVEASDPLGKVLDIFRKTRFAFVPVAIDGRVVTSLSVRDVLRIAAGKLVTEVGELASQLVSVKYHTSIEKSLELMLEKGIRNLALRNQNNDTRIVNDRKILEYLLSYEGRRVITSPMGLDGISIDLLALPGPKYIKQSLPAGIAAELMSDVNTPCLLLPNDSIVTPWDIVMKGIRA